MNVRRLRPAWWLVFWGLMASLSVNSVLPAFDHHASDYSPIHGHVVLGGLSASQREQALAAHTHGAAEPHAHAAVELHAHVATEPHAHAGAAPGHPPGAVVAVEDTPAVAGISLLSELLTLAAGTVHMLVVSDWILSQPLLALWLSLLPAALLLRRQMTPPPEQPPRCH